MAKGAKVKNNKCFSVMAGCGLALVSLSALAQPTQDKIYFRIDTGYSWASSPQFKDDPAPAGACIICAADGVTPTQINNINNTWLIGVGVGYRISDNFRSDIAYSYRGGAEIIGHDGVNTAISTKIKSNAVFLNGYFDFPVKAKSITPYVGAGAGWANNQLGTVSYVPVGAILGTPTNLTGGTTNNFAWNAGFGVGIEISKGTIIDIGYRYVDLGKLKLDTQNALGTTPGYSASAQLRANEIQFSFRF
jgi:opacity protein-like surface antigen